MPEAQSVNIRNRNYVVGAWVDIPAPGVNGVLFAQGSRFGAHALYVKDGRLRYVYNFVGMLEQRVVSTEDVPIGENLIVSASFDKDGEDPPGVSTGPWLFTGGTLKMVAVDVTGEPYVDLERAAAAMIARE